MPERCALLFGVDLYLNEESRRPKEGDDNISLDVHSSSQYRMSLNMGFKLARIPLSRDGSHSSNGRDTAFVETIRGKQYVGRHKIYGVSNGRRVGKRPDFLGQCHAEGSIPWIRNNAEPRSHTMSLVSLPYNTALSVQSADAKVRCDKTLGRGQLGSDERAPRSMSR